MYLATFNNCWCNNISQVKPTEQNRWQMVEGEWGKVLSQHREGDFHKDTVYLTGLWSVPPQSGWLHGDLLFRVVWGFLT